MFTNPGGGALAGTILYNKRSLRVSHNGEVQKVQDEDGDIVGLCAGAEFLEASFTFTPYGTSAANALVSHSIPELLAKATISGADTIPVGGFADSLNDPSGGLWIYEGGAELNFDAGVNPSSMTITLRRYAGITSNSAIS